MNILSSSSSSDESGSTECDEMVDNVIDLNKYFSVRRSKIYKTKLHPLDYYSDDEFRKRFRFTKEGFSFIQQLLEPILKEPNLRGLPIEIADKILIALRFYATNSFQTVVGDLVGIDQATTCRILHKVTSAILSKFHDFIEMPNDTEKIKISTDFYMQSGIPNIIGLIDGTHIPITSPGGTDAELFRNRKGWFSLNCQIVCDSK